MTGSDQTDQLRNKTKQFAIGILKLCAPLPKTPETLAIQTPLVKAATTLPAVVPTNTVSPTDTAVARLNTVSPPVEFVATMNRVTRGSVIRSISAAPIFLSVPWA